MLKDWLLPPVCPDRDAVAARLGVSPTLAQVLHNRGLQNPDDSARFLNPKLSELRPPEELPGAVEAAGRIVDAIQSGRKIVLYGDYDVDGVAGVAILWHAIRLAGGMADYYVPHRLEEGYGLNVAALDALADAGASLVVSVDCGVTALEAAAAARRRGRSPTADTLPAACAKLPSPHGLRDRCAATSCDATHGRMRPGAMSAANETRSCISVGRLAALLKE
jgi:single-stranded-DNA-specific exonuclease